MRFHTKIIWNIETIMILRIKRILKLNIILEFTRENIIYCTLYVRIYVYNECDEVFLGIDSQTCSCRNYSHVDRVRYQIIISTSESRKCQYQFICRILNYRKIRQRSACVLGNRWALLFIFLEKSWKLFWTLFSCTCKRGKKIKSQRISNPRWLRPAVWVSACAFGEI